FVFQSFNLIPRTTARENVETPLLYARTATAAHRVDDVMSRIGIDHRARHYPDALSGGEQQRVAIARALVNAPSLLIADEPTGNLDSRTSLEIMAALQPLNARGISIIIVTHNPEIAAYTRRQVVMRDGRVVSDEPVAALRSAQADWSAAVKSR